ncbi:MAG: hypothetical protein ACOZNI_26995 [Myxococcota bacterium]
MILLLACFESSGPPSWAQDARWLDGTWSDGQGHSIEGWTKEIDLGGARAIEGYYRADGFWDGPAEGRWNYGAWDPEVVLNLTHEGGAHFAAVRLITKDQLRVRVSASPEAPLQPGFMDGEGVIVLNRAR